jgi:hypothetical protein
VGKYIRECLLERPKNRWEDDMKLGKIVCGNGRTSSGSCSVAAFGISGDEHPNSVAKVFLTTFL